MSTRVSMRVTAAGVATFVAAAGFAGAQPVSEARLAELMAQARAQVQASTSATAAQAVDLTMDEVVQRALERNLDINVERINPQLQDLSLAQVRGAYATTLVGTFGQRNQVRVPSTQLNGGVRVQNNTTTFNGGVSKVMPWYGGTTSITFNNSRAETDDAFTTFNPSYNAGLALSYTQPLMRNFRIDSTRQQIMTQTISRQVSDITLRATITTTLANARNAYWDLLYTRQAVEAARRALTLAEKLVEDNKIRVEIGTLAPLDIVQAEAEAATRRQTLTQAEASQRTAELVLKRLVVSGTDDPLWTQEINPVDRPTFEAVPIDLEAAVRRALTERTDLIQSRKQLESNDITIKYLANQKMPQLDLAASYNASGIGGTGFKRASLGGQITEVFPGGYSDALNAVWHRLYPTWNLALTFSYPLGDSSAEVQHARAKLQVTQTQAQIKSLELRVATEVTNAALSVESNLKRVEASRAASELSLKRLEAEQSKFDVGMSTNFLVVQAQRDLFDAQITELRAMLDYTKSLVDFERVQQVSGSSSGVSAVSSASSTTAVR